MKKETNGTVKTSDALYIASMATGNGVDYPFCCIMAALRRNDVKFDGVKCGFSNDEGDCKLGAECKKCNLEAELFDIFEEIDPNTENSLVMTSPGFSPIYVANMAANIAANIVAINSHNVGYVIEPEYSIYTDTWTATVAWRRKEDKIPMPEKTEYTIHGVDWIAYVTVKNNNGERPRPWIHGITFRADGCVMMSVSSPTAPTPPPVAAPVATTVAEGVNAVKDFNSLVEKLNSLRTVLGTVMSEMSNLGKQIPLLDQEGVQGSPQSAAPHTERKESVFTKPVPISDMLCVFLGVPQGSLMSRSEVTTRVCAYAKTHNLLDKQVIKADSALRMLLSLTPNDELRILNLQRFLRPHYLTV